MNTQVGKSILIGVLTGLALFVLPFFLLRLAIFFLIVGAIFRLAGGRRRRHAYAFGPAFADRIRAMSDEEYATFKQRFSGPCARPTQRFQQQQESVNQ